MSGKGKQSGKGNEGARDAGQQDIHCRRSRSPSAAVVSARTVSRTRLCSRGQSAEVRMCIEVRQSVEVRVNVDIRLNADMNKSEEQGTHEGTGVLLSP